MSEKEARSYSELSTRAIIDAVTNLNLRDLGAEAKALSSSSEVGTSASGSAKGKAKDP
jgi:hypothetical protein